MRLFRITNAILVIIVLLGSISPSFQQVGGDTGAGQAAGATLPLDPGPAGTQPIGVISTQQQGDTPLSLTPVATTEPDLRPAVPQTTAPAGAAAATTEPDTRPAVPQTTVPAGAAAATTEPDTRPAVPQTTAPAGAAAATTEPDTRPAVPQTNVPLDAGTAETAPIAAGTDFGTQQPTADPTPAPTFTPLPDPAQMTPGDPIPVESDKADDSKDTTPPAPPGPPKNWEFLPEDKTITFGLELVGPSLVPWTKTKSWNFVQTLHDKVFQSVDVSSSIEVGVTDTYRKQVEDKNLPGSDTSYKEDSGVQMRVAVNTNSIRVESEVKSMVQAIQSGDLAKDLGIALGTEITNITMITDPEVTPYNSVADPNESSGGSLPGWIIGAIVGGIIILIPIPGYLLYRRSKRKHIEALAKQQAEAAAARQRMQSRIIKSTGGKSFSYQTGDEMMEGGLSGQEYYLNTPNGSVTDRQISGNWAQHGRTPSGLVLQVDQSGRSVNTVNGYGGNSPTRALRQQSQRALYQQNSLGPGGMPPVNRVGSFTGANTPNSVRHTPGSVYPVRYSDSASLPSSSSGNNSR